MQAQAHERRVQRKFRLTRSEDFDRTRRTGKSYASRLVVLVVRPNEIDHVRVGVAAGRSVGNAVKRNRAKRMLRAAMRGLLNSVTPGWDIVVLARSALIESDQSELRDVLASLLRRAEIMPVPGSAAKP